MDVSTYLSLNNIAFISGVSLCIFTIYRHRHTLAWQLYKQYAMVSKKLSKLLARRISMPVNKIQSRRLPRLVSILDKWRKKTGIILSQLRHNLRNMSGNIYEIILDDKLHLTLNGADLTTTCNYQTYVYNASLILSYKSYESNDTETVEIEFDMTNFINTLLCRDGVFLFDSDFIDIYLDMLSFIQKTDISIAWYKASINFGYMDRDFNIGHTEATSILLYRDIENLLNIVKEA